MNAQEPEGQAIVRIVVLGGGFGGIYTVRRLEKLFRRRDDVQILLVSRDNFLLMTPLLFEVCSGKLEMSACSISIREFLRSVGFIEAVVETIDLERRLVILSSGGSDKRELRYDHLILALGSSTNTGRILGSQEALTFKTLADAVLLRNQVIERMERAEVESDPDRRHRELTFVVIGGGLVGVEIFGELTAFMDEVVGYYPRIRREEISLHLLEAGERIMPEIPEELANYSARVLGRRTGVTIRAKTPVERITPGCVHLKDEVIEASTVVLSAGTTPSPLVAGLPVEKDSRGKILVDATMRCKEHPELWAAGDCASIPDPNGKPYPELAQHAMREAKVLAENIYATVNGLPVKPFVYKTKGIMASLGRHRGVAAAMGIPLRGFLAWWIRRSYYLMVTPRMAQRIRLMAEWTLAVFFSPPLSKLDLNTEKEMLLRYMAMEALETQGAPNAKSHPR
ncbi:MAG TPA: NAD(P)/FAD-dependent oxidoreductase [Candidatus Binataceae bacterium]|nr:NAD(P)/FAD-dependent oxidoreductase [Candidatus Binataceae bacterium]